MCDYFSFFVIQSNLIQSPGWKFVTFTFPAHVCPNRQSPVAYNTGLQMPISVIPRNLEQVYVTSMKAPTPCHTTNGTAGLVAVYTDPVRSGGGASSQKP